MNKNSSMALLIIGCGILILLHQLGFGLGWIGGYVFPIGLLALGYYGLKSGRKVIGWVLIAFGALILLGKLSGLIVWIIAIGLIVYGFNLLKRKTV